jgi:hypothetical protein
LSWVAFARAELVLGVVFAELSGEIADGGLHFERSGRKGIEKIKGGGNQIAL